MKGIVLDDGRVIVQNGAVVVGAAAVNVVTIDFLARGGDDYPSEEPRHGPRCLLPAGSPELHRRAARREDHGSAVPGGRLRADHRAAPAPLQLLTNNMPRPAGALLLLSRRNVDGAAARRLRRSYGICVLVLSTLSPAVDLSASEQTWAVAAAAVTDIWRERARAAA